MPSSYEYSVFELHTYIREVLFRDLSKHLHSFVWSNGGQGSISEMTPYKPTVEEITRVFKLVYIHKYLFTDQVFNNYMEGFVNKYNPILDKYHHTTLRWSFGKLTCLFNSHIFDHQVVFEIPYGEDDE